MVNTGLFEVYKDYGLYCWGLLVAGYRWVLLYGIQSLGGLVLLATALLLVDRHLPLSSLVTNIRIVLVSYHNLIAFICCY